MHCTTLRSCYRPGGFGKLALFVGKIVSILEPVSMSALVVHVCRQVWSTCLGNSSVRVVNYK